jgi:putative aldouronate transport system substrate-binding protein
MERTGVTIEFIHPPSGGATEQFNLFIASGDLPDLMEYNWLGYPGGPEKAIADGIILRLNDVFARNSPYITAYLRANPDIDKMIRTDNGSYYNYPMIRDENNRTPTVSVLRKDWLDEHRLQVPTTYDEWHNVLTVFKGRNGVTPLSIQSGFLFSNEAVFSYGYDTRHGLYVGFDGRVHWGQIDPGYRDYVALMNQWFREGLLDPDVMSITGQQVNTKMINGSAAASIGYIGGSMGGWLTPARQTNPSYMLVATPVPVKNKGDTANFSSISSAYNNAGGCVAITTKCSNVATAAKLLDWGYSAEGIRYYSYGVEGVSFTMVNNIPTYTSLVLRNPAGWTVAQGLSAYTRVNYNAPSIPDGNYIQQYYEFQEQKDAIKVGLPATAARLVPPLTPTAEESAEYASIMNEINTYSNEMLTRFVLGTENLSNWDTYVRTINNMRLPRALEIQNAALARYSRR